MPDLSVSEAQLERLEEIREELEAVHVGEYGTVRPRDAFQYLLDTCPPPEAEATTESDPASGVDLDALTAIDGVGEATAESLVDAGFPTVESVADADPNAIAEIDGIGDAQAVDIVASATEIDGQKTSDDWADDGSNQSSGEASPGAPNGGSDSPEDTLQEAMSLLDSHDDRWRESSGEEPYEVDLPDGSTEAVRTKDDIKRLIFKHWR
jgi:predicted flap endonuclease-1-like 5' DNA nuclease